MEHRIEPLVHFGREPPVVVPGVVEEHAILSGRNEVSDPEGPTIKRPILNRNLIRNSNKIIQK
jgi:hypothetical protein